MGHHYIPQYYLEGFTSLESKQIWVYEKNGPLKFPTFVKSTANENKYYSQEVETYLANEIEAPANAVIKKLRNREQITNEDKMILSIYMVVMLKRVPESKRRMREMAPGVAEKIRVKWEKETSELITINPDQEDELKHRLKELKESQEKFLNDPPKDFWLALIRPETTPNVIYYLQQMTWCFLTFDDEPMFLTCDNPVFYFSDLGIGKPESEVTFPISSNITLFLTWRNYIEGYYPITTQACKEINRRTAFNATRFIYHAKDENWVQDVAKKNPKLNFLWLNNQGLTPMPFKATAKSCLE